MPLHDLASELILGYSQRLEKRKEGGGRVKQTRHEPHKYYEISIHSVNRTIDRSTNSYPGNCALAEDYQHRD